MPAESLVRPARLVDVPALHRLISAYASKDILLERSQSELYENLRDFGVIDDPDQPNELLGCVALHVYSAELSELKSLAVAEAGQGKGLGRQLVEWCVGEAARIGLQRVFCLTYQTEFFEKLHFVRVDRSRLPEKVWGECVRCRQFFDCHEVALWREVNARARQSDTA